MRRLIFPMTMFLLCSATCFADDKPEVEVYLGYSVMRAPGSSVLASPVPVGAFNLYGGGGSLAINVKKSLGIVGDLGVLNGSAGAKAGQLTTYLFGPRLSYRRHHRFRPYLHFLIGGAHADP